MDSKQRDYKDGNWQQKGHEDLIYDGGALITAELLIDFSAIGVLVTV